MRERVWCHEMLISCCVIVLFSSIFFDFSSTTFAISLFLCSSVWRLTLVVFYSSFKLTNSSTKWQSPSQIWSVAQNNHPFLVKGTAWALSSHYSIWLLDILPDHLSLGSTAPLGRPLASFENSFIRFESIQWMSLFILSLHQNSQICSLSIKISRRFDLFTMIVLVVIIVSPSVTDCHGEREREQRWSVIKSQTKLFIVEFERKKQEEIFFLFHLGSIGGNLIKLEIFTFDGQGTYPRPCFKSVTRRKKKHKSSMAHAYSTIRIQVRQLMLLSFSPIIMVSPNNDFFTRSFSSPSRLAIHRLLSRASISMLSIDRWPMWRTISTQSVQSNVAVLWIFLSFGWTRFVFTRCLVYIRDVVLLFTTSVSSQEDLLWAVMQPLTAAIVNLFDGFEFPKEDMQFDGVWWNTQGYLWILILF